MTARLADTGAGRGVAVEGLHGATRVAELLVRAALALGLPYKATVAARCQQRWLKVDQKLEGAELPAGGVVDMCVGEGGGMPGNTAEEAGMVGEELAGALGSLLGQYSHDVSRMEGAGQRLESVRDGAGDRRVLAPEAEVRRGAEGWRRAEAEARWRRDERSLAEAEVRLRAAVERLRTRCAALPLAARQAAPAPATAEVLWSGGLSFSGVQSRIDRLGCRVIDYGVHG